MNDVVTINDSNFQDFIEPIINGEKKKMGLIPRNFNTHPPGCYSVAPVFDTGLIIPENEWKSRLKDQQDAKASLFDLRERYYDTLKSLDQDGFGYCWAFSTTKAVMYIRAVMNQFDRLSAWAVASIIKNYRDQGGWGSESLEWIAKNGVPTLEKWPQGAGGSSARQYDTPDMRANAALHKVTEWWDGTQSREQNKKIMISAFLRGEAPTLDYNWLGHSMCGCRLVSIDPLVVDCDNSWGEDAGTKGLYRVEGSRAIPDDICVARVATGT